MHGNCNHIRAGRQCDDIEGHHLLFGGIRVAAGRKAGGKTGVGDDAGRQPQPQCFGPVHINHRAIIRAHRGDEGAGNQIVARDVDGRPKVVGVPGGQTRGRGVGSEQGRSNEWNDARIVFRRQQARAGWPGCIVVARQRPVHRVEVVGQVVTPDTVEVEHAIRYRRAGQAKIHRQRHWRAGHGAERVRDAHGKSRVMVGRSDCGNGVIVSGATGNENAIAIPLICQRRAARCCDLEHCRVAEKNGWGSGRLCEGGGLSESGCMSDEGRRDTQPGTPPMSSFPPLRCGDAQLIQHVSKNQPHLPAIVTLDYPRKNR